MGEDEDEDEERSNVKSESFFSFETHSFFFLVFFSFGNDAKRNSSPSMGV